MIISAVDEMLGCSSVTSLCQFESSSTFCVEFVKAAKSVLLVIQSYLVQQLTKKILVRDNKPLIFFSMGMRNMCQCSSFKCFLDSVNH